MENSQCERASCECDRALASPEVPFRLSSLTLWMECGLSVLLCDLRIAYQEHIAHRLPGYHALPFYFSKSRAIASTLSIEGSLPTFEPTSTPSA